MRAVQQIRLAQSLHEASDKDTGEDEPDECDGENAYRRCDAAIRNVVEARQGYLET